MPLLSDVVDQEPQRTAGMADDDVDVAVVIDIAERRTATDLRDLECRARSRADVLETAAAGVAEQLFALPQGKRLVPRDRLDILRHRAVDREDVEPAVVVGIQ